MQKNGTFKHVPGRGYENFTEKIKACSLTEDAFAYSYRPHSIDAYPYNFNYYICFDIP